MNLSFYEAIDRVPLGIAVTIEFAGPLASRSPARIGGSTCSGRCWRRSGIVLLATRGRVDRRRWPPARAARRGRWAAYILLAARAGRRSPAAAGWRWDGRRRADPVRPRRRRGGRATCSTPELLALGAAVALLSSVIPYSLETEALRRMPRDVFGVLMSLEPALAALAGFSSSTSTSARATCGDRARDRGQHRCNRGAARAHRRLNL